MERFNELSRGMQVMLVGSVLLLIDSFFDWQQVSGTVFGQDITAGASGWHGVGFIMGILTIVLIAWIVVRLAAANVKLPVSDAMTGALLGFLILLFTVIKFFADNEARHWPAWVGLILAVVIAVGAWWAVQEAGGLDTLKTEASDVQSSMSRPDCGRLAARSLAPARGLAARPPPAASPPPDAPTRGAPTRSSRGARPAGAADGTDGAERPCREHDAAPRRAAAREPARLSRGLIRTSKGGSRAALLVSRRRRRAARPVTRRWSGGRPPPRPWAPRAGR